jgi:hypothetical protein
MSLYLKQLSEKNYSNCCLIHIFYDFDLDLTTINGERIMRENARKEEIFSKVLRAGRRTYFFDVRATKADDYYITITESKKIH